MNNNMNSCWSLGPGVLVSLDKLGISEQERRKKIGEQWEKNGEKHRGHWSVSAYNQYHNRIENTPYGIYPHNSCFKDDKFRSIALIEYIYPKLIDKKYILVQKKYSNNKKKHPLSISVPLEGSEEEFQNNGVNKKKRLFKNNII
tara:strand:+ start:134 stop:565 length:432 start_codon:yes stop_codon:yes gene_type:complete